MATLERRSFDWNEWDKCLSAIPNAVVFQSAGWLRFLSEALNAEVITAVLRDGKEDLGYFCGLKLKKFGMEVLGSPFRGWSTPYMGFALRQGVSHRDAAKALPVFAFTELGCLHFEVVDLNMKPAEADGLQMGQTANHTMEIDLTQSEDELLANMTKTCRWTVRKAEKNGLIIEQAHDEDFARDYAEQLKDVFAKQGLVPHLNESWVRSLIHNLNPSGMLLMLRAKDPQGRCIGTGIYPAMNETAFYWGGASWREYQKLYPNELLHWHAIRYWKSRGMKKYNMVGTMDFKRKFGGAETAAPVLMKSKYALISAARSAAPTLIKTGMRLAWKLKRIGKSP